MLPFSRVKVPSYFEVSCNICYFQNILHPKYRQKKMSYLKLYSVLQILSWEKDVIYFHETKKNVRLQFAQDLCHQCRTMNDYLTVSAFFLLFSGLCKKRSGNSTRCHWIIFARKDWLTLIWTGYLQWISGKISTLALILPHITLGLGSWKSFRKDKMVNINQEEKTELWIKWLNSF